MGYTIVTASALLFRTCAREHPPAESTRHGEFVESTKQYTDIIEPHGVQNAVAIEMIAAHIRERLRMVPT